VKLIYISYAFALLTLIIIENAGMGAIAMPSFIFCLKEMLVDPLEQ
jgi:hypothetical protein